MIEFQSFRKEVDAEMKKRKATALKAIGGFVTGQAKLLASGFKEPTGRLMGSIKHDETDNSTEIYTNVEYAIYVEKGTKPHAILPKKKKALSFVSGGKRIVTKSVFHPGTKAQPFLTPAAERNIDKIKKLAQEVMSDG